MFTKELSFDNFIEVSVDDLNNMLHNKYNRFPLFERVHEIAKRIAYNNYDGSTKKASSIERELKDNLNIKLDLKDIFNNFFKVNIVRFHMLLIINTYVMKMLAFFYIEKFISGI